MFISNTVIGRNILKARKQASLTQAAVAEMIELSDLHYGRIERGERRASLEQLAIIAFALNVQFSTLLSGAILNNALVEPHNISPDNFIQSISFIAEGCSDGTKDLMLSVCKLLADKDKAVNK